MFILGGVHNERFHCTTSRLSRNMAVNVTIIQIPNYFMLHYCLSLYKVESHFARIKEICSSSMYMVIALVYDSVVV